MSHIPEIDWHRVDLLVAMALDEDLTSVGDTTTRAVIPETAQSRAVLLAKQDLVCCGLDVAKRVFHAIDGSIRWEQQIKEGDFCPKGTVLANAFGSSRSLLTAERTVLNFIQRLSGIATVSQKYAQLIPEGCATVILDTRKTTPGWRNLEKYAVAVGGATNHRIGLYDRIMIKDNHREIAGMEGPGGIERSVLRAREMWPNLEIEVEADTVEQVREAVSAGAEYVLLDNMTNEQMAESVAIGRGKCKLEASGGITFERIPEIARLGVDFISVGALTHSVKSADISLDVMPS